MSKETRDSLLHWLKCAGARAARTWAQALLACLPTTAATLGSVDWPMAASTACLAAAISLLTSMAGIPESSDGASVARIAGE